ncbi:MAG: hypothetical protein WA159_03980, partial [Variovorax sp.]
TAAEAGRSYVVFGKSSSSPLDLSSLTAGTSTAGFVINGQASSDYSGYSVASAGDVNGDGLDDLIVGAINADPNGASNAGRSYVVYGRTSGTVVNVSALTAGSSSDGFVINGEAGSDNAGWSVASAGDVNGDGLGDLIVGAPTSDPSGTSNAGRSYVVFGQTGGAAIQLSSLTAGTGSGFVINGQCANDASGTSVSSAGDINGDGLDDLLVGVKAADPASGTDAGRTYVVFGQTGTTAIDLSALNAGNSTQGFAINGASTGDGSGGAVSSAGDVNGDGFDDLLIGASNGDPSAGSNAGRSYVVFGGNYLSPTVLAQLGTIGTANVLVGTAGADTLIGRDQADILTGNGGADVIYGGAGNDMIRLNNSNADVLVEPTARIDGGTGIDTLAMVNTDNAAMTLDLTVIGASKLSGIERFDITGTANNTLVLNAAQLLQMQDQLGQSGINAFSSLGGVAANTGRIQVMVVGDAGDVLQLANSANLVGTVDGYNAYNMTSSNIQLLVSTDVKVSTAVAAPVELSSLTTGTSTQGFVINGLSGEGSGYSVSSAGDVNGDGIVDLIVGAPNATAGGLAAAGRSYVVYGQSNGTVVDLSTIANGASTAGFVINGQAASDNSGYSVSAAGDVNGDGLADLIVGAYNSDPAGGTNAGRSYVVFGKTGNVAVSLSALTATTTAGFVINGQAASDSSGYSVSSAGDVNGDGRADLIVGAYANDGTAADAGRSYVVFGKTSGAAINLSALTATTTAGFVINGQAASDY